MKNLIPLIKREPWEELRDIRTEIQTTSQVMSDLFAKEMALIRKCRDSLNDTPISRVTSRELDVLSLVRTGLVNKEIGNQLNITERTVKFHVSSILQKFGVSCRADLIRSVGVLPKPGATS